MIARTRGVNPTAAQQQGVSECWRDLFNVMGHEHQRGRAPAGHRPAVGTIRELIDEPEEFFPRHRVEAGARFVDTYLATIGPAGLVPHDRTDAELLLGVYQLQKGLYEIRYELANRPDWVHWPLSAVAEMIGTS